ncbi:MAG: alpha-L-fucosidase [bacterium]
MFRTILIIALLVLLTIVVPVCAAPATPIAYDTANAIYTLGVGGGRDFQRLRIICRSGKFTTGDVPGVQDSYGVPLDVRDLTLADAAISGSVTVLRTDGATLKLDATVKDGQVTGSAVNGKGTKLVLTGRLSFPIATQENITWFETARLGIGMHWSISSVKGGGPSWPMQGSGGKPGMPKEVYEGQMQQFKGQNFNPEAWAKLFKDAGAQYFIPYVKHHDGFAMWDTQTHDYKVTKTPCGRDVIGELFSASRKEGLKIGVRYSQADWHIMPLDMWPGGAALHARFHGLDFAQLAEHFGKDGAEAAKLTVKDTSGKSVELTKEQLAKLQTYEKVWAEYRPVMMKQYEELLTKYGKIDLIGGDGGYPVSADEQIEMAQKFREWQPDIIFGARVFFNCPVLYDTPVFEWPGERPKPGERVYPIGARVPEVWQSFTNWGNGPRRGDVSKPILDLVTEKDVDTKGPEAVGLLVRCASLSWNLLYDIGPHDTGDLAATNVAHLRGLARYMKVNAESITGTWGGPYQPCWLTTCKAPPRGTEKGFVWGTTRKGNRIFLHVTDWNGSETVALPPLPDRKVTKCTLLATGDAVAFEQNEKGISITVPTVKRQWVDTVIVLTLDGSAEELPILPVPAVEPAKE